MANEIFGVDIAAIVAETFTGNLHPVTLYKITSTTGDYGEPIQTAVAHSGDGVRGYWSSETAVQRGYPVDAARLTILQNGIPAPEKGDRVEILGERFIVLDINQDPVNATWDVAAALDRGDPPTASGTPTDAEFVISWGD